MKAATVSIQYQPGDFYMSQGHDYYGAAEPPVRCGEALPQLSVNRIEIKVPK